jgi:hypothetical protein
VRGEPGLVKQWFREWKKQIDRCCMELELVIKEAK